MTSIVSLQQLPRILNRVFERDVESRHNAEAQCIGEGINEW